MSRPHDSPHLGPHTYHARRNWKSREHTHVPIPVLPYVCTPPRARTLPLEPSLRDTGRKPTTRRLRARDCTSVRLRFIGSSIDSRCSGFRPDNLYPMTVSNRGPHLLSTPCRAYGAALAPQFKNRNSFNIFLSFFFYTKSPSVLSLSRLHVHGRPSPQNTQAGYWIGCCFTGPVSMGCSA